MVTLSRHVSLTSEQGTCRPAEWCGMDHTRPLSRSDLRQTISRWLRWNVSARNSEYYIITYLLSTCIALGHFTLQTNSDQKYNITQK